MEVQFYEPHPIITISLPNSFHLSQETKERKQQEQCFSTHKHYESKKMGKNRKRKTFLPEYIYIYKKKKNWPR